LADDASPGLLDDRWIWRRVRAASEVVGTDLTSQGLFPVAPDRATQEIFFSAARHLAAVPDLQAELRQLIQEVTPLVADFGYDISHSDPKWPNAVFVSVPSANENYQALRLLENLVHEGMHLRLTRIELSCPLVRHDADLLFSPWKGEDRQAQGVLHGLYVFVCLATLFARPRMLADLDGEGKTYATRRIAEIGHELTQVNLALLENSLTEHGQKFMRTLLSSETEESPWALIPL
jgi:HEXXH motif-containing protein